MSIIRKINVGPDYKSGMSFTCGQTVMSGTHTVYDITRNESGTNVYVLNELKEVFLWKTFGSTVPVSFEYNIDF